MQPMAGQGSLPDHVEQCRDSGYGTVSQVTNVHRHDVFRDLATTEEVIKGFYNGGVHLFIRLM